MSLQEQVNLCDSTDRIKASNAVEEGAVAWTVSACPLLTQKSFCLMTKLSQHNILVNNSFHSCVTEYKHTII